MKINYNKIGKPRRYKYSKGGGLTKLLSDFGKNKFKDEKTYSFFTNYLNNPPTVKNVKVEDLAKMPKEHLKMWEEILKEGGISMADSNIELIVAAINTFIDAQVKTTKSTFFIDNVAKTKLGKQILKELVDLNVNLYSQKELNEAIPKITKKLLKEQYSDSKEVKRRVMNTLKDSGSYEHHKAEEIAEQLSRNPDKINLEVLEREKGYFEDYEGNNFQGLAYTHPEIVRKEFLRDYGVKLKDNTNSLVVVPKNPDADRYKKAVSTGLHEGSHILQLAKLSGKLFIDFIGYSKLVKSKFNKNTIKDFDDYLFSPREFHARIQEIRHHINPSSPWSTVSKSELLDLKNKLPHENFNVKNLIERVEKSNKLDVLLEFINDYWVVGAGTGVAAGVAYGANQMGSNQQLRKGGKIVYKNNKGRRR